MLCSRYNGESGRWGPVILPVRRDDLRTGRCWPDRIRFILSSLERRQQNRNWFLRLGKLCWDVHGPTGRPPGVTEPREHAASAASPVSATLAAASAAVPVSAALAAASAAAVARPVPGAPGMSRVPAGRAAARDAA